MELRKKGTSGQRELVMTYLVGIVISARSFGLAQDSVFFSFFFFYIHSVCIFACCCYVLSYLLVKNDIDHTKALHARNSSAYAKTFGTFILCAAKYWLSVFLKDTQNPKGPRECEFMLFRSTLHYQSEMGCLLGTVVLLLPFSSHVSVSCEAGGEYLLDGTFQKYHIDSAALFACVPFRVRVYRILREPLTLGSPVPRSVFLMWNLIVTTHIMCEA